MSLTVEIQKKLGNFSLDVAFSAEEGVLGLLGASGSGKSMTLKCIAGIETPDSGRIVLDGVTLYDSAKKINLPPQRRQVGYLFQQYALFPNMTVEGNILCGLHAERDKRVRQEELQRVISLLQLEGLEKHRPNQLSGGQQQRTALARILVNKPKLLLLDEPFAALDSHLRERLQLELRELLKTVNRPALFVTHSRDEAYRLCPRIAILDDGKLLACGETGDIFTHPRTEAAARLTGCKNIAPARRVDEHHVEVPDWGVTLASAEPVGDWVTAVGIRAHSFSPEETENRFPVRCERDMEEPFEWIVEFRTERQTPESPALWWRYAKTLGITEKPTALGIPAEDVLLLGARP